MRSDAAIKKQLAMSVIKGKIVELKLLQEGYIERWKLHAHRQGKDPNKPPKTIYSQMIADRIEHLTEELKELEGYQNEPKGKINEAV